MVRKVSVVGRGTAGCLSIINFINNFGIEIDWIYNPDIPTTSVGEGTTFVIPEFLNINMGLTFDAASKFNSTVKTGIKKINWAGSGSFSHSFPLGTTGMHFSAIDFQSFVFNEVKNKSRVRIIEDDADISNIDSDYIMVCTGAKPIEEERFEANHIPVNAAHVKGFEWDNAAITETLCIAMPHGWVFVIPLQNRCSFGYIYNKNVSGYQEVESDLDNLISKYKSSFNLKNQLTEQTLYFDNYVRKNNFSDRIAYNGNSSFFLEPLEATSTTVIHQINDEAITLWDHEGILTVEDCNNNYLQILDEIEGMICLHYLAGSNYNTNFWNYAEKLAYEKIKNILDRGGDFPEIVVNSALQVYDKPDVLFYRDVGTWNIGSYNQNIKNLDLADRILEIAKEVGYNV